MNRFLRQIFRFGDGQMLIKELRSRGLLYQMTHDGILDQKLQDQKQQHVYCGFDPTASSLHLGNLMAILMLRRAQKYGYNPIALIGGATGMIGDPSGKSGERQLQSIEIIQQNTIKIQNQLQRLFGNCGIVLVNNYDFYKTMGCLDFLRDIGKQFRINQLLSRDIVQNRINDDSGLSYTEFSYGLLQAYDFLELYRKYNCIIQFGGSDQWGNIISGCDLIRRQCSQTVYGITSPLLIDKNGKKFGKSENNALFLDEGLTSREEMSQYILNQSDDIIESLFMKLTFLEIEEIHNHSLNPSSRIGQKRLNQELQVIIYGKYKAPTNEKLHNLDWDLIMNSSSLQQIDQFFVDIDKVTYMRHQIVNFNFMDLLLDSKCVSNKSEGKRLIESGGLYVKNKRVQPQEIKNLDQFLHDRLICDKYLIIRMGKKEYKLIEII